MERIAIAELNLSEVKAINEENAKTALSRKGGKILFITPKEEEEEMLDETKYGTLNIISTETYGSGPCHQWLLGAELWKGKLQLLCEDTSGYEWSWKDIEDISDYEKNMVYELIINKYNEDYEY